ncbi:MAG: aminoacetone oxidase family FAD-binding enzyme [Chlorobiaceae bacterium]
MAKIKINSERTKPSATPHVSILIIGGGASGMAAAISARKAAESLGIKARACKITLVERNPGFGAKIRISGGGKCNVTHEGSPEELLQKGFIRKNEQRFLRNAIYSFSGADLLELLLSKGVATAKRPDGKLFPESGEASSVAHALEGLLSDSKVEEISSCRVLGVERTDDRFLVTLPGATLTADAVILATGGLSYRKTGTTGDGLAIARKLGHAIVEPSAALTPLRTTHPLSSSLSGLALRSCSLVAESGERRVERRGDLLFTHRGFSGPAALSLSRDVAELLRERGRASLFVDLFPEQSPAELDRLLLLQVKKHGAQMVRKFLQICPIAPPEGGFSTSPHGTIPTALVPMILRHAALDDVVTWSTLPKEKRVLLVAVLKRFPLGTVRELSLDAGEVSAGGVSLLEVNPKTMQSRVVSNLYVCGELLDYAGEIGGFNLQAAFSTGWLAGMHAAKGLAG